VNDIREETENRMDRFLGNEGRYTLDFVSSLGLLSTRESFSIQSALAEYTLAACLNHAESVHLHVKMDDTDQLRSAALEGAGGVLDHGRHGFVKYRMPGSVNLIFSHIPTSADDLRECAAQRRPRPFLDHVGVDVRVVSAAAREAFDALPALTLSRGWAHVAQGAAGRPVHCCHVEVDEKHWLFPDGEGVLPLEIALGPLRRASGAAGCDLRPSHPALMALKPCCAN
jgi:hypothetical protein